jgi:hypothetical protein
MDLAKIVAIAVMLWVLGTASGPNVGYDNTLPPPAPTGTSK